MGDWLDNQLTIWHIGEMAEWQNRDSMKIEPERVAKSAEVYWEMGFRGKLTLRELLIGILRAKKAIKLLSLDYPAVVGRKIVVELACPNALVRKLCE